MGGAHHTASFDIDDQRSERGRATRRVAVVSGLAVLASIVMLFVPGPKLGTDFRGGTEVEVADDIWGGIFDYEWSPDSAHLAFSLNNEAGFSRVFIWSASGPASTSWLMTLGTFSSPSRNSL